MTLRDRTAFVSLDDWFDAALQPEGECLIWSGARHQQGYGYFWLDGHQKLTHIYAVERIVGPLRPGQQVNHHCDNRPCARYDHLYVGCQSDNIADMERRGRRASGPRLATKAKLTADEVTTMRRRLAAGETQSGLAREFGVSQASVSAIARRRSWAHVA